MSITFSLVCDSQAVHPSRTVATISYEPIFGWVPDRRIRTRYGFAGYTIRCSGTAGCGDMIRVHPDDLHAVLDRLAQDNRRVVTIRDLQAIRRLTEARLRGPEQRSPSDGGDLFMPGGSA